MVRKIECPGCRGNRVVRIKAEQGKELVRTCPDCNGQGFKVQLVRH